MVHHHIYIYTHIGIQSCLLEVFFQPSNTQIYEFYELSFCRQEQEEETIYKEIHGILDKTHGTNIHGRSMACKNGGNAKLCAFKDEGQHTSHFCREFLVLNRYMKMWISYVQVGITVVVSLSCSPHVLLWPWHLQKSRPFVDMTSPWRGSIPHNYYHKKCASTKGPRCF